MLPEWAIRSGPRGNIYFNPEKVRAALQQAWVGCCSADRVRIVAWALAVVQLHPAKATSRTQPAGQWRTSCPLHVQARQLRSVVSP